MRRHSDLLLLGGLSLVLALGAAGAMSYALGAITALSRYWSGAVVNPQPGDAEYDAMNALQRLSDMLVEVVPWMVVAAIIPAAGAIVLLTVRAQPAGSASATASRVASSD